jgi:hypothetical protein
MIEKFEDYIGGLPLTRVVKERINELLELNSKIKECEIDDIFICEFKNEEGTRNYTSLWLFNEKYCIECKNFMSLYDFDITPYNKRIDYCSITPVNFDFVTPTNQSIINIHFHFGFGIAGNLIATEENCLSALNIYKKYIISNLND